MRFKWGFMRLGPDFSHFGHNLLLESQEKQNAGQNCFQTVTSYFTFFFSMFLDIISSM